jgi:murein DD-endopeptidase MepM/ murein hydrolase activator NlpD
MGGACFFVLLCMSCRHSASSANDVHHAVDVTADKMRHSGVYHEVKQGQTLWSIARAYRVDVQTLARVNQVSDMAALPTGQKLYVPGATRQREIVSRCPCGTETVKPMPDAKSFSGILRPSQRSPVAKVAPNPATTKEAFLANIVLIWPVQGDVSRGFEQEATRRHDGIDIIAPKGASIQAAAEGEVIFSGWGPGGYGRIVILQHQADLVTIYAHNHENLVRLGQHVRQGESIATVGQSGRATGNHLHFEVRHKAVPISPYKLLPYRPSNVAALDGG